jgi:hypothetical protein
VRAARDELGDLGVVVDVGKAEAHFAIGHDVEEIEAGLAVLDAGLDDAVDPRLADFAYAPSDFSSMVVSPPSALPGAKLA